MQNKMLMLRFSGDLGLEGTGKLKWRRNCEAKCL